MTDEEKKIAEEEKAAEAKAKEEEEAAAKAALKAKGGKTILITRAGGQTKCSKERLQGLLNAGWVEVKE